MKIKNVIFLFLFVIFFISCDKPALTVITGNTMGTVYTVKIADKLREKSVLEVKNKIEAVLQTVNNQMSTWQKNSEISLFNKSSSVRWQPVSYDFAFVTKKALEVGEFSYGYFDITVYPLVNLWGFGPNNNFKKPEEKLLNEIKKQIGYKKLQARLNPPAIKKSVPALSIDLSAIAKGFGVDKVCGYLDKSGYKNYMVEIGGEVRAKGINSNGVPWKVGIASPKDDGTLTSILNLDNLAVATSGDYRNYREIDGVRISHTIDPTTCKPVVHNLTSVSVVAETCCMADAYATAFNTMGLEKAMVLANKNSIPVFFIYRENGTFKTKTNKYFDTLVIDY
jgi:thiamine biosynthesis lipoprotein